MPGLPPMMAFTSSGLFIMILHSSMYLRQSMPAGLEIESKFSSAS